MDPAWFALRVPQLKNQVISDAGWLVTCWVGVVATKIQVRAESWEWQLPSEGKRPQQEECEWYHVGVAFLILFRLSKTLRNSFVFPWRFFHHAIVRARRLRMTQVQWTTETIATQVLRQLRARETQA